MTFETDSPPHVPWIDHRYVRLLIVAAAVGLIFATAMSRSFSDGRLAAPITHNDVNYFIFAIQRAALLQTQGFLALVSDFIHGSTHAPITSYQPLLAYMIFGITDWAPYVTNIMYIIILLGFAAYLLRDCPALVVVAAMACLIAMPLSSDLITEVAPELVCGLFTAIGAVLMVRLSVIDTPLRSRFCAGLCFSLGFLAHPSAFPFTIIALVATVGLTFLRDIVWPWKVEALKVGSVNSLVNVLLAVWFPALYMIPRYNEYWQYFYDALFNPATSWVWINKLTVLQQVKYFLSGSGGQFMFGNRLWVYAGIVGAGIVAAWWRNDRQSLAREIELLVLAFVFWFIPTLAPSKGYFFATAFGFLVAFMTAFALRSVYRALGNTRGVIAVSVLGILSLVLYQPSAFTYPNVPTTSLAREFAWSAIDRFKTVLLGNEPEYHNAKIYMTNIGAFAPNMLQYYLLKTDPTLDWIFDSKWMDADPTEHIEFIHSSRQDIVIAGQRGNGLTNSPFAWPAEDAVFAAMIQDPGYMAIDRFYGPGGREVGVFQRRGSFAGWHPISGIINRSGRPDDPRDIPDGRGYLQTFAASPVQADLEIEWAGAAAGQKLTVFVNYQRTAELTFEPGRESSSLKQEISLSGGNNDILLQSDNALTLRYLLIVPHIGLSPANRGISITSATYGGNCGATPGNATQDVTASCNGKTDCTYSVKVERLGDAAPGCGKDYAVSYFCPSDAATRHQQLPGEAGLGSVLKLSCAPASKD